MKFTKFLREFFFSNSNFYFSVYTVNHTTLTKWKKKLIYFTNNKKKAVSEINMKFRSKKMEIVFSCKTNSVFFTVHYVALTLYLYWKGCCIYKVLQTMNSLFHERKSHRISYPNSRLLQPARTCMHAYWQNMQTSASMQERVCPTELELKDREKCESVLFTLICTTCFAHKRMHHTHIPTSWC